VSTTEPAIVFVGFMCAGKSRAARAAARALGATAIDTDDLLADRLGEPLAEHFHRAGEAAFRSAEEQVVLEALERGGIVALGGGSIESERVRETLGSHVVAWCRVSEEVAWERARGTDRPLAADRREFARRYEARSPIYRKVADAILPRGGDETGEAAAPWLAAMRGRRETCMAWARAGGREYPAMVGSGAVELLAASPAAEAGERLFGVLDRDAVAAGVPVPPGLEATIDFAGGEEAKTLGEAERQLSRLAELGVRRDDALVAVGGGVVGDLAGFCAAIYQRGVPVIQVPTTLVGQVDSAYGGKTGVDLAAAKNYVGAYHQPAAVLADPGLLATLPDAELAAGFAEVTKTALIAGGELWARVREVDPADRDALGDLVLDCVLTKLEVVAEDERDAGRRAVLNLGHTVGHAIEAATGYRRYRHGEAVGLGLLAALTVSGRPELRGEVAGILGRAGLPLELDPEVGVDAVLAATELDKKRTAAGLGMVLVDEPGTVRHGQRVPAEELRAAVEELGR
jgi:shikimate kinase / 3-dehydroquinate synthase